MAETLYEGAQFLGAKKSQALSTLADVIGKTKGEFGKQMGKRKIWDKIGDIAQFVGNKFIPGAGNIADLLIDQLSSRMIDVPTGEAISKQQSGWTLGESKAAADEFGLMVSEVDPNKTLLSDILQEGVEFAGSEAGDEMIDKVGLSDWFSKIFGGGMEGTPVIDQGWPTAREGGRVPKYYGGGSVSGGSPTIAGYFSQQGKTLGGSNTESISKILGKI